MSFLTLNGFDIGIASGGSSDDSAGALNRTDLGALKSNMVRTVDRYDLTTILDDLTTSRAIEKLVDGATNGEVWSFDNGLFSAKGTRTAQSGAVVTLERPGKFGLSYLTVSSGGFIVTNRIGEDWTIGLWYFDGTSWEHQIARSDGAQWIDNVRDDGASVAFTVNADGELTLDNADTGSDQGYDDVVWLPFDIPDVWGEEWDTTQAFSPLPYLRAAGDMVVGEPLVLGGDVDMTFAKGVDDDDTSTPIVASVSFSLRETGDGAGVTVSDYLNAVVLGEAGFTSDQVVAFYSHDDSA